MADLPILIPCDGRCGVWLPGDTEPCALTPNGGTGHRNVYLCALCKASILKRKIETKA